MKKTLIYLSAFLLSSFAFFSCEDPYANQKVASPTMYEQEAIQDANFQTSVVPNPLVITADKLNSNFDLIKVNSLPTLVDTTANVEYKLLVSNTTDFAVSKFIPVTYGTGTTTLSASYKVVNDTLKALNPTLTSHAVYARVLAYIVTGGTKALYTTPNLTITATTYNFPPVAVNDTVVAIKDNDLIYNVLANDSDPEGDQLSLTAVSTPSHGTATFSGSSIIYTPSTGYVGSDVFNYTVSDGNSTSTGKVVITVTAMKQYFEVAVKTWYIVGLGGAWNNSVSGLGSDLIPLSVVSGYKYNDAGDGEFTYTGYFFASSSFKLINIPGNWDIQWGNNGGEGMNNLVKNNSGASNIKVPSDGYYTIHLNSINNTLSIVPATVTPSTHTLIGLIGGFNGWGGDVALTPNANTNGHVWYTTWTLSSDNEGKFRADGGWSVNWGDSHFPIGQGVQNGANIPMKAGTYKVIFNDIDGCYYFIAVG